MITVSVDLSDKWYGLSLSVPEGETLPEEVRTQIIWGSSGLYHVAFPDEVDASFGGYYGRHGSPFVDHAPNPRHVMAWAKRHGFRVHRISLELMIGRWELECGEDRYADMLEGAL